MEPNIQGNVQQFCELNSYCSAKQMVQLQNRVDFKTGIATMAVDHDELRCHNHATAHLQQEEYCTSYLSFINVRQVRQRRSSRNPCVHRQLQSAHAPSAAWIVELFSRSCGTRVKVRGCALRLDDGRANAKSVGGKNLSQFLRIVFST